MQLEQTPFYQKLALNLICLVLLTLIVIYGKSIILPLLFAILFANLILPVNNFFASKGFNRSLSILTPLALSIILGLGICFFLSSQVAQFIDDLPALEERSKALATSLQQWVDGHIHMSVQKQNQYISKGMEDLKEQSPKVIGATFASLKGILTYLVLVPIFTFLILYYKKTIKAFLVGSFRNGSPQKVNEVLNESTTVAQHYMTGLLIETTIVFTLNVIGFLIVGVKYTVFLALLAAILNLIPYVGILVANVLCIVITLTSSDNPTDAIWVGAVLALVQLFDNNFGMPVIVGNKVKINALATIVGVLAGGAIAGIPGMFLAIPGLAVLKIIFDKVPELKHWGMLLGDEHDDAPKTGRLSLVKSRIKTKHKTTDQ